MHWYVNSIVDHDFVKRTKLEAYNALHSYDFICLSEIWIDLTVSSESAFTSSTKKL